MQQGRTSTSVGLQWVKLSPDGRYLCAFSSEAEPQLWDVRASKRIAVPDFHLTPERDRDRLEAAFTPDATHLAIRDSANSILLYSLPDARLLARLSTHGGVSGLEFSADGKYLATTDGFNLWATRAPENN